MTGPASCAKPTPEPKPEATVATCSFDGIDTSALPRSAWEPERSPAGEHRRLRPGQAEPRARRYVRVALNATHHSSNQMSVHAEPGPDGLWHADIVERSSDGGLLAAPEKVTRRDRVLSASESAELEEMLAGPCLYVEPTRITFEFRDVPGVPGYCSSFITANVEVVTPGRVHRAVQVCGSWGTAGRIARLLSKRGS